MLTTQLITSHSTEQNTTQLITHYSSSYVVIAIRVWRLRVCLMLPTHDTTKAHNQSQNEGVLIGRKKIARCFEIARERERERRFHATAGHHNDHHAADHSTADHYHNRNRLQLQRPIPPAREEYSSNQTTRPSFERSSYR